MAMFASSVEFETSLFMGAMVVIIPASVIVALFPFAMLRREALKRYLRQRNCEPIQVRWLVWRAWCPDAVVGLMNVFAMPFRVIYSDPNRCLHKAYCWIGQDLYARQPAPRKVEWIKDEIIGELPEASVRGEGN
jgi:hypothetical protein